MRYGELTEKRSSSECADWLRSEPLMILRTLSSAAAENEPLDEDLSRVLHEQRGLVRSIAASSIRKELFRLLEGEYILPILLEYGDVLAMLIPEIAAAQGFDQRSDWHRYDVWEHSCRALAAASHRDRSVRLALLFHDLAKPICFSLDEAGKGHFYGHARTGAEIAQRRMRALGFDRAYIAQISELVFLHLDTLQPEKAENWLFRLGEKQLHRLIRLKRADAAAHADSVVQERQADLDVFTKALDALCHGSGVAAQERAPKSLYARAEARTRHECI